MKARLLNKLLGNPGYIISENEGYIAVGSPYVHNLISVDKKTMNIKYALDTFGEGRKSIQNDLLVSIWDKLHDLVESGEIIDIINGADEIVKPLLVYCIKDDELVESITDEYGWPNVTSDGELMYENTHYKTKGEAIAHGIKNITSQLEYIDESISEATNRLKEETDRRSLCLKRLNHLNILQTKIVKDCDREELDDEERGE
jgi:hypothetical protein